MKREIETIETHYGKGASGTKAAAIPDAYIVNFKNEEGFAVLGANTDVAPIVAVTEKGSLEPGFLDIDFEDDPITEDVDGNTIDLSTFNFYSEEYNDYYVMQTAPKQLIQECLRNGIAAGTGSSSDERYSTTGIGFSYFNHSTEWDQGDWDEKGVYNRYCYKYTLIGKEKKYVKAGCSTTAMATIVAYNEFPANLYVLGKKIDYKKIKSVDNPISSDRTSEEIKEGVGLLFGSIFHSVNPTFCLKKGTCITPEEIKKCFELFGYINVKKYEDSSFSSSLKKATSDMLANKKPVFISAMPHLGINGHSWVIDGSCYNGDTWMLHCDWGGGGKDNGFVSSDCFKPKSDSDELSKEYKEYTWHFRVVTYDIPNETDPEANRYIHVTF